MPWCIVGGWSIDLFLGEQTRPHADVEISILRADQLAVRTHLAPLVFRTAVDGEIRAIADGAVLPASMFQYWAFDLGRQEWRLEVMVEPGDEQAWIYRRDQRVTAPRSRMIGTSADGIPYLRPEGALLYKAKATSRRPKDDADFASCLPHLDGAAKRWLADALTLVDPDHPWLAFLEH